MKIVHVSDIHCGREFNSKKFELAVREINRIRPDVIVATGDLTHDGYITEYRRVKEIMEKFKCKNILLGAGNHDYLHTGYLLFNRIFWEGDDQDDDSNIDLKIKNVRKKIIEFEDYIFIMLATARPDKREGEVGYRQIKWIKKTLEASREKYPGKFSIVAMHHHIIPVPDTGLEKTTINDAGDILGALTKNKVDLVLCGHRHRPWIWNIENMPIIHAGSISSNIFRGFYANSYNIIKIENGIIDARVKVVGGEEIEFDRILEGYCVYD